jgi:tetratricopeptide (TPR) repeat protein
MLPTLRSGDCPAGIEPEEIELLLKLDQGFGSGFGQAFLVRHGDALAVLHRPASVGRMALVPLELGLPRIEAGRWGEDELVLATAAGERHRIDVSRSRDAVLALLERLYREHEAARPLRDLLERRLEALRDGLRRRPLLLELGGLNEQLGDADKAFACYRELAAARPPAEEAVAGLARLAAGSGAAAESATEILCGIHQARRQWPALATILERRAEHASGPERGKRLREAIALARGPLGDSPRALGLAGLLLTEDPSDETLAIVDELAARTGLWAQAAAAYRTAEEHTEDPARDALLVARIARAHERAGMLDEAAAAWLELSWLEPRNLAAFEALHVLLRKLERWEELAETLGRLAALSSEAREKIARLRELAAVREEKLGALELALDAQRELLAIAPKDQQALEAVARLHRAREDWAALVEAQVARAAAAFEPRSKSAALADAAGVAAERLGDGARAVTLWLEVLLLRGDDPEALAALAPLYEASGDFAALAAVLERHARTVAGAEAVALFVRAAVVRFESLSDAEGALAALRRARAIAPDDRELLERIERLEALCGHHAERASTLAALIERTPEPRLRRELFDERARVLRDELRDPEGALAAWEAAHGIEALDDDVLAGLIDVARSLGRYDRAMAACDRVAGGGISLLARKAELASDAADAGLARGAWEAVRAVDPAHDEACARLEALLLDDPAALLELHVDRARVVPEEAGRRTCVAAELARELGDADRALALLEQGALLAWREPAFADGLGRAAEAAPARALAVLDALVAGTAENERKPVGEVCDAVLDRLRKHVRDVPVAIAVARHLEGRGKTKRAMEAWQRVLEIDASHLEAEASVRRLMLAQGRDADVARHLEALVSREDVPPRRRAELALELARVLEGLGRPEEAAAARKIASASSGAGRALALMIAVAAVLVWFFASRC